MIPQTDIKFNEIKHGLYIVSTPIGNLDDIEKSEIYLPFAAQKLLTEKIITIDVIDF